MGHLHFFSLDNCISFFSLPHLLPVASDWGCGQEASLGQAHSSHWDAFTKMWNSASHSVPLWCLAGEYQEILLGLRCCW